ncbi:GNAT family N-acetyltransferase [Acetivibrio cellulolyticus]|uniref:GNAT family N-acetyltransferase n=1 Tax=Acetivibrio cellulolyticus TaxID=35830 RepID=UPI0001E2EC3D|nr:GNAT family N-acetyltransferase [Acetivibrio cellulolyticus]
MMNYEFEKVKEEYLPELLDIYTYYVLNTTATFHEKPLSISEMRELVIFKDSKYETYVIKDGTQLCGYVILTQHKKREAYDNTGEITIYLKSDYIGKGIGSRAITFIECIAKSKGFHVLIATICGENEKSIRLFERNGYVKCAHYKEVGRKFGNWLDLVAYQKLI